MRAVLLIQKSRARTLGDAAELLSRHLEMSKQHAYRLAGAAFAALGLEHKARSPKGYERTDAHRADLSERMRARWRDPYYRALWTKWRGTRADTAKSQYVRRPLVRMPQDACR